MREAGLAVRTDAAGNVIGRLEAAAAGAPALVLGSHYDTVRDAGKYDGPLGIVTAIACAAALSRRSAGLPFALEVMAFAEEEGVRFGTTLLGSRAVAGSLNPAVLACADPAGQTIAAAMAGQGLDPARIGTAARRHEAVLAYVELHIEQGPVLEARGLPVGVVSSISGAVRYAVDVSGEAGHAGTVPMGSRHDALTAASACVLAVEACAAQHGAVATVGVLEVANGAVNVIPGHVRFTIDLRMPDDTHLRQCEADLLRQIGDIAVSRGVKLDTRKIHANPAVPCAPWLAGQIAASIRAEGCEVFALPSGAGHDGQAMAALCDIGMIFVRCAGGISHNPAESVSAHDAACGARVLLRFIEHFRPKDAA